jgi:DNA polymerase-4
MAVCGDPKSRHGIILAKNETAKKYGILTAETVGQAKRKCPSLILVSPHYDEYKKYSHMVNQIYENYTDLIEPFGIDESWLDISGTLHLFGNASFIADTIRRQVREELGITVSIGVSFNKVFAKLGSDYKKPDATTVITRFNYKEIVYPLPVDSLLYVGKSTAKTLTALGIYTIGQLANADPKLLSRQMGKLGEMIHSYANGLDQSPVKRLHQEHKPKSIGNGVTFPRDLFGILDVRPAVLSLCDMVATRLRQQDLSCKTLCITIKYPNFKSISRQRTLNVPTNLSKELTKAALEIIQDAGGFETPIRMLTVTASHLYEANEPFLQLSLFDTRDKPSLLKQQQLEKTIDDIRNKFGHESIFLSSTAKDELGLIPPKSKNKKRKNP